MIGEKLMNQPVCFIINAGALGDLVATLPVLKYAVENIWTDGKYHVLIPMYFRELLWFIPDDKISSIDEPYNFSEPHAFVNLNYVIQTPQGPSSDRLTPLKLHLTDYASINLLGMVLKNEDKNYVNLPLESVDIKKFNVPEKYVCIVATSQYKNRSIPEQVIGEVVDDCIAKGLTPVLIGKSERSVISLGTPDNYGSVFETKEGVVNLVDKTSLMEVAKVMSSAECVIGCDTGLLHLAGCTETKIIGVYTNVSPDIRLPYRHGKLGWNVECVVPEESKCGFCQSKWFISGHNFNKCYTQSYECVTGLTSHQIIDCIQRG